MQLSFEEQRFVAKRASLKRTWRYVGAVLLTAIAGLGMWLFISNPLLANPFVVLSQLRSDAIPESILTLMAAMLPVVVLLCIVLSFTIVVSIYAAFSNERKYLSIIQRECREQGFAHQGATIDTVRPHL